VAEEKLTYDEVAVGDEAPALTHTLTRADLVQYAGASGDFNPMHTDEVSAQAAGLPSVFGHGMFTMGILGKALTDYAGVGNLASYKVRFTKQTWPDEVLTTKIEVAGKREEDGKRLVDLTCSVANADGQVKVDGSAVAVAE
jgi:acyl dehydratase